VHSIVLCSLYTCVNPSQKDKHLVLWLFDIAARQAFVNGPAQKACQLALQVIHFSSEENLDTGLNYYSIQPLPEESAKLCPSVRASACSQGKQFF